MESEANGMGCLLIVIYAYSCFNTTFVNMSTMKSSYDKSHTILHISVTQGFRLPSPVEKQNYSTTFSVMVLGCVPQIFAYCTCICISCTCITICLMNVLFCEVLILVQLQAYYLPFFLKNELFHKYFSNFLIISTEQLFCKSRLIECL